MAAPAARPPVLVTGGAGYIGSHVVLALAESGFRPVVLDDLSSGHRALVPAGVPLVRGDAGDAGLVGGLLREHAIAAVLHFAGSIVVEESVARPLVYYRNNTCGSRSLIEACVGAGLKAFVFSSTAAVYGVPRRLPVPERAATRPASPYGASKLMTEWMLRDAGTAHDLKSVCLRYFNVAGADASGRAGQAGAQASHLIRLACQVALGRRPALVIYGDDWPTADGTCVRDFIHVTDLAEAHVLALRHLLDGGRNLVLNCGYGRGHSVRQVVQAVGTAAGAALPVRVGPRRPGDVPVLVADVGRIGRELGWRPRHDDLDGIVRSALAWERRLVGGLPDTAR